MPDGGEMAAFVALPEAGHGPGLLVLMEIFGVGTYIRRAAERLAELGYVALAPDLYRRTDPGLELEHDQEGLQAAFAAAGKLDIAGRGARTRSTALEHLRGCRRSTAPTGVLGFCLGGSLAFSRRGRGRPGRSRSVYYGSTVAGLARGRRPDQLPGAVSLRRRGSLHPAGAGRAGRRRGGPAPRLGVPHPARRAATHSTTTSRRCSTGRRRPTGLGADLRVPRARAPDLGRRPTGG